MAQAAGAEDRQRKAPLDVPVGYRVGDWTVTEPLGSGSWGSVYAAAGADGARAAVKFLRTGLLTPGQRTSMDELIGREVRFSLAADHPHLVGTRAALTVRDPDRPELDGSVALVMDLAEHTVRDLLEDAVPGTPLPDAVRVLRGVSAGLAHLHGQGWLHGDLKPANILLGAQGEVWLADFGLTTELDGTHAYLPPLGSLDHLPPEWWSQRTGSQGTAVRPTADVWAFGVLAHEVLSGGLHPFPGSGPRARSIAAQSYARGAAQLRLHDAVPEGWRQLITECLAPDHTSRSALTAAKLADRVRQLGAAPGRRRRRPVILAALGAALLAAGTGTGLLLALDGHPAAENPADKAPAHPSMSTSASASAVDTASGDLPARSDIPVALRPYITAAARHCAAAEVTPDLIAAMLKAESGFNANARRPSTGEYGIAMWTPSVFGPWSVDGDHNGIKDYMSAPDAIATMGAYLCWIEDELQGSGVHTDLQARIAASYRTNVKTVVDAGGVPARIEPYITKVRRYLADYSRP